MDPSRLRRIRCSGSGIQRWRAILREWLMEEEEVEAISDIATLWEDPQHILDEHGRSSELSTMHSTLTSLSGFIS